PLALRFLIALRAIEREDGAKEAGALRARFQAFTGSVEVYRLADRRGVVGQIPATSSNPSLKRSRRRFAPFGIPRSMGSRSATFRASVSVSLASDGSMPQ